MKKLFFLTLIFLLGGLMLLSAVTIDGVNDFPAQSLFLTSTAGYTNYLAWTNDSLWIGMEGEDVNAVAPSVFFVLYLSTNSNSGSAYGYTYSGQRPVLPFKADFLVEFESTVAWRSAVWDGTAWNFSNPFTINPVDYNQNGNYLEFELHKSDIGSPDYLSLWGAAYSNSQTYAIWPASSGADGLNPEVTNFFQFSNTVFTDGVTYNDAAFILNDQTVPYTNIMQNLTPPLSNTWGEVTTFSNLSADDNGLVEVSFYTNGSLLTNFRPLAPVSNFVYNLMTTNWAPGSYDIFATARDTWSTVHSITNTWVLLSAPVMDISKTIDAVEIFSTNLLIPGSRIRYKILYSNTGGGFATNVVIADRIPAHTVFLTNYLGVTTTGWDMQYAHIDNPDQSYSSVDYDTGATNVKWVRFRKASVDATDDNKELFISVTLD